MSNIPKFGVYKGMMTSYEESKMSEGDKVWFTDPDGDLSSGLYTIDRICGEVYSLSNDDGAVEAFEHELEVFEDE